MTVKSERLELRLDAQTVERLDEWRRQQSDFPARSEAVRRLMNYGFNDTAPTALFEATRFQVLCAALLPGAGDRLNDAYVYAWETGVYPLYHDDRLAAPFAAHFRVSREKVESLMKYLDREWLNKNTYTFYELEDHFGVRYSDAEWDRYGLISALRYAHLSGNFDAAFWNTLLEAMKHPSEASVICYPFNRERDVYFQ